MGPFIADSKPFIEVDLAIRAICVCSLVLHNYIRIWAVVKIRVRFGYPG